MAHEHRRAAHRRADVGLGQWMVGHTILLPVAGTGMPRKLVTANNGNFWLEAASPLPTRPKASLCPTTIQMTNPAADGNCNSCHGTGSRIALP